MKVSPAAGLPATRLRHHRNQARPWLAVLDNPPVQPVPPVPRRTRCNTVVHSIRRRNRVNLFPARCAACAGWRNGSLLICGNSACLSGCIQAMWIWCWNGGFTIDFRRADLHGRLEAVSSFLIYPLIYRLNGEVVKAGGTTIIAAVRLVPQRGRVRADFAE